MALSKEELSFICAVNDGPLDRVLIKTATKDDARQLSKVIRHDYQGYDPNVDELKDLAKNKLRKLILGIPEAPVETTDVSNVTVDELFNNTNVNK